MIAGPDIRIPLIVRNLKKGDPQTINCNRIIATSKQKERKRERMMPSICCWLLVHTAHCTSPNRQQRRLLSASGSPNVNDCSIEYQGQGARPMFRFNDDSFPFNPMQEEIRRNIEGQHFLEQHRGIYDFGGAIPQLNGFIQAVYSQEYATQEDKDKEDKYYRLKESIARVEDPQSGVPLARTGRMLNATEFKDGGITFRQRGEEDFMAVEWEDNEEAFALCGRPQCGIRWIDLEQCPSHTDCIFCRQGSTATRWKIKIIDSPSDPAIDPSSNPPMDSPPPTDPVRNPPSDDKSVEDDEAIRNSNKKRSKSTMIGVMQKLRKVKRVENSDCSM